MGYSQWVATMAMRPDIEEVRLSVLEMVGVYDSPSFFTSSPDTPTMRFDPDVPASPALDEAMWVFGSALHLPAALPRYTCEWSYFPGSQCEEQVH
ncbi:hypothetical protein CEK26_008612 [Fusarium fujikuroi]|uniref:Uncharacterized protein n=1 Tax=Fusarium fujikuroi TaxID=5127 RepID=A0A5Q3DE72_FUSFU|nr:uncharacterized protein Y057_2286 [Fusarium fujikuroi]QGI64657.1 hypothetical protein CEK27_008628 [Fusarium fujikuroi]QGI95543.1 hypothetical protein CEK26_008612 [Fusarium fujikuroi]VTT57153.1 unnamed protein product [Fusarium fujikuroi]VTT71819.1 unnamed protein product [Fusarium fujikuroi]